MNHIKKRQLEDTQCASKRKYNQISLEKRISLLKDILNNRMPISDVAIKHQVKLSTVKVILKLYRKEGRIGKLDVPQLNKTQLVDNEKQQEQSQRTIAEPSNEEEQRYYQLCMFLSQQLEQLKQVNFSLQQKLIFPCYQFQCQNI